MKRDKKIVLRSIRNILQQIAPAGTKAILFGSQARGDAHEGSDWDILINDGQKNSFKEIRIIRFYCC